MVDFVLDAKLSKNSYAQTPSVVDGWRPVILDTERFNFSKADPQFGAYLYEKDGQYKVAFRGTQPNGSDWANNPPIGGVWQQEMTDAIRYAGAALRYLIEEQKMTLDQARRALSVTGHSQGGFQAELAAKFYGLNGTSLDGPGMAQFLLSTNFTKHLRDEQRALGIADLKDSYDIGDFQVRVYTLVGRLMFHVAGTEVSYSLTAKAAIASWLGGPGVGAAITAAGMTAHLMDFIISTETLRAQNRWYRLIGDNAQQDPFSTPAGIARALAGEISAVQVGGPGAPDPLLTQFVQEQIAQFLAGREGQQVSIQKGSGGALLEASDGAVLVVDGQGNATLTRKVGDSVATNIYQSRVLVQEIVSSEVLDTAGRRTLSLDNTFRDANGSISSRSVYSQVLSSVGEPTHALEVAYNPQGQVTQTRLTERQPDNTLLTTVRDSRGQTLFTIQKQSFDDGTYIEYITQNGRNYVVAGDAINNTRTDPREVFTTTQIAEQRQAQQYADMAGFINALHGKDKLGVVLYGAKIFINQQLIDGNNNPSLTGLQKGLEGLGATIGIVAGLNALTSDDALTQLNGAVGLLNSANAMAGVLGVTSGINPATGKPIEGFLSGDSIKLLQGAGAVLSIANLKNLDEMLASGQVGSAIGSVVTAINGIGFLATGGASALSGASALIPIDPVTFVVAVVILNGLYEEDPPPPPPTGEAWFVRNAQGVLGYQIANANDLGRGILTTHMDALLAKLKQQMQEANTGHTDPGQRLDLVASRMPKVHIQAWPSRQGNGETNFYFMLEGQHPQNGQAYFQGIARQDLVRHYAQGLALPEAIATTWTLDHLKAKFGNSESNWKTEGQYLTSLSPIEQERARLQETLASAEAQLKGLKSIRLLLGGMGMGGNVRAEDTTPTAGLTRQQRVAAAEAAQASATAALELFEARNPTDPQRAATIVDAGLLQTATAGQINAARDSAKHQWLKAIAVDWGSDGIDIKRLPEGVIQHDLEALTNDGVTRFDADNDGYREATEWLGAGDSFLGLDRDGNGLLDAASELFSGATTPWDQRGLQSLKYYDSNKDGQITQADPVYKLLRLWFDMNGDGSAGSMETVNLQMGYVGVDMVALKARLAALGSAGLQELAAIDAMAQKAVVSIDLKTFAMRLKDGSSVNLQNVQFKAETAGILAWMDEDTQNLVVQEEAQAGAAGRNAYVTVVQDMGSLLELQNPNITATRRTELLALAAKYGLNTQAAGFLDVVRNIRTGGENMGANGVTVTFTDDDVWTNVALRQQLQALNFSFVSAQEVSRASVVTGTAAFDDRWRAGRVVAASEVQGDAPGLPVTPGPNPEQWVLPADVYSLDLVVTGAQLGGLVTQRAVVASNAARPGAPAQTIQVFTAARPTVQLAAAMLTAREDERVGFGYAQLEQEARSLITGQSALTVTRMLGVRSVSHGYVEMDDANAMLRFVSEKDYAGTEAGFSYAVMDGQGRVLERRVNIALAAVNDAPDVLGERISAREDEPLIFDAASLLANDTDKEGDSLRIIGIGRVGSGRAELLVTGQIRYVPPQDLYGITDTLEYIVQDSRGATAVGVVKITLNAVDDAPTVVSELIRNTKEDVNLRIDPALLLANDFDPDTDARVGAARLRITAVGKATHGSVFQDVNGQLIFAPEENFNGRASFEYTVTDATGLSTLNRTEIDVAAVNDGPVLNGEVVASREDERLVIDPMLLLSNDEDADIARGENQRLMLVGVDQATNGTVELSDGKVVFTPHANATGIASFRYSVSDGNGGLAQAVARVELAAVNDAPVAPNQRFAGREDNAIRINARQLLEGATDVDSPLDRLQVIGVSDPLGGSVQRTVEGAETFYTFTPNANYNGLAGFSFRVADDLGANTTARATLDISAVNDAPVFLQGSKFTTKGLEDQTVRIDESAIVKMFADPDGDLLSLDFLALRALNAGDQVRWDAATRQVVFTPLANANGVRQIMVGTKDPAGLASEPVALALDIAPLNDRPTVNAVGFQMLEDGGINDGRTAAWTWVSYSLLLQGASDVDGDTLRITGIANGGAPRGTQLLNDAANQRVGIKAPLNYNGGLNFSFTVSDGKGGDVTQTAYGNVKAVNDLPIVSVSLLSAPRLNDRYSYMNYQVSSFDIEDGVGSGAFEISRYPVNGTAGARTKVIVGRGGPIFLNAPANQFYINNWFAGSGTRDDYVQLKVTDSQGGAGYNNLYFRSVGTDPIVIDLGSDGLDFIDPAQSQAYFDTDGDGVKERLGWIGANEGILAWDHNRDGVINRFDEIEFWHHLPEPVPGMPDLQVLAAPSFDTNQDGRFDAQDAKWSEFRLWQDKNSNGVSDAGELQTLQQAGVKALYLQTNVLNRAYGAGAVVRGYTRVEMQDGRFLQAGDVQLRAWDAVTDAVGAQPVGAQNVTALTPEQAQALAAQQAASTAGGNQAPVAYGQVPLQYAQEDEFFSLEIAPNFFIDRDVGDKLSFSATRTNGSALPAWLQFDAQGLRFFGTPTGADSGDIAVRLSARDGQGAVATSDFSIWVAPVNDAPYLAKPLGLVGMKVGQANSYVIAADTFKDDDAGDALTLTVLQTNGQPLPGWLRFDAATRALSGMPAPAQIAAPLALRVVATDLAGESVSTVLTLTASIVGTGGNDTLVGTQYSEMLSGEAGDDLLDGGVGADTLVGGVGNDTYAVDAFDTVLERAGEGTDTVVSAVTWILGDNLENLVLTGTAAIGGTGNGLDNLLTGNSAANVLSGGAGSDTYKGYAGMGRDRIVENDSTAGNTDVLSFGPGIDLSQLWLRQVVNDLEVSVIGTGDSATVQNWYLGSQYHVEKITTSAGKALLDSSVQNLVQAMAAFAPPPMGQTTLAASTQNALANVFAANWK